MMIMTNEQFEKVKYLDQIFGALSVDQFRELAESDRIVATLKGNNSQPEIFKNLILEHDVMRMDIITLKGETMTLRNDIQTLSKLILKPYDSNSPMDAQLLKNKFNIY